MCLCNHTDSMTSVGVSNICLHHHSSSERKANKAMTLALLFSHSTDSNTLSKSSICKTTETQDLSLILERLYFFFFGKLASTRKCVQVCPVGIKFWNIKLHCRYYDKSGLYDIQSKPHNLVDKWLRWDLCLKISLFGFNCMWHNKCMCVKREI